MALQRKTPLKSSGEGLKRDYIRKNPEPLKRNTNWVQSTRSPNGTRLAKKSGRLKVKPKSKEQIAEEKEALQKQWDMFHKHWAMKPHQCESCNKNLWGENLSLYHHHCWPKSQYPQYKYVIEGLMLVCWQCHQNIESGYINEELKEKIERIKQRVLEIS